MAAHRSPNCPQISFEEASTRGRKVYEKEHTHPAPKAAVAEDLGYAGISGASLSMIGALRQYGILEGSSEAMRITEDAVAYFELEDGSERSDAMIRMIFNPPFFSALRQQFGDALPSESNLKHHLIKEGFLPKAAEDVIKVYRENISLVSSVSKRFTAESAANSETSLTLGTNISLPSNATQIAPSIYSFSFPLSFEAKADLQIRGAVGNDELEMLRDHIEMTIKALKRSKAKPDTPLADETR